VASVFGAGDQYLSWIALDDLLGGLTHALLDDSLRGPVNLTAPTPVTQRRFAKTLGRVLHRPAIGRIPAWVMRTVAGELADEVMLASTRVEPERLLEAGYRFRTADLESALRHMLGREETRT
jgi:NAD dependent epimerase/dehydratase family enzyme